MDPPRLLAHGDHARARSLCRSEVNVAHFRERISHHIVDCPLADLTTLYVRDRNTKREGDRSRREHLVPVGNQQQQVRPHLPQQIGQGKHGHAQRLDLEQEKLSLYCKRYNVHKSTLIEIMDNIVDRERGY